MFNVIEKEMAWRKSQGLREGFEGLRDCRPIVAVGAKEPLGGQRMMADYFREWMLWFCLGSWLVCFVFTGSLLLLCLCCGGDFFVLMSFWLCIRGFGLICIVADISAR